jgi:pyridoxal 5'-phosphate synthase pdxS subunit
MMRLGAQAVFVGSGVFKSSDPPERGRAIVHAVTHFEDPVELIKASRMCGGEPMSGLDVKKLAPEELLAGRGW